MSELTTEALAELVKSALAELGSTPDEVANALRNAGIRGSRAECGTCPVALWLILRVPELCSTPGVCDWDVHRRGVLADDDYWLPLPEAVADFITAFDHDGAYRDLDRLAVTS